LAEGVKVAVVKPFGLDIVAAVPPFSAQNGDTLYFEVGDVPPFATATVQLTVKTSCANLLIGQTLCVETFAALENACPSTLPAFSEIKLAAKCVGDTLVRFTLKNIGDAPTQNVHTYQIIRNDAVGSAINFSLNAQQSIAVDMPADGATYRMEATNLDDGSLTATALENCGGLTPGQITAFWLDEGLLAHDFDCRQVIGSYDPNQKTAVPTGAGPEHILAANRPLLYTIDFQNTGTDTAFRVLLRDMLDKNLDIESFRPGFASHPYTWEIRGGNWLEVLFLPIMLPDSNVNEAASHGFFSFTIDQKPDLPNGTYLFNTASIIFDFNPPIWTNYVQHFIGQLTVAVDEPQASAGLWQVWGNPTRDQATFQASEFIPGEKRFALFDGSGRPVRVAQFSEQTFDFQRDGLPAGLYFFKISDASGRVFSGKIVVTE
ncbi:MAG: T9SS type A sorting domain-containing protein, partial [Saprospiraceae bacterium]